MADGLQLIPTAGQAPGGASEIGKLNRAYIVNQGQFLLHQNNGHAGYVWETGQFFDDDIQLILLASLNIADRLILGWHYRSVDTPTFNDFLGDAPSSTSGDGAPLFLVYFSLDNQRYFPWPLGPFATVHQLDPTSPNPPGQPANTLPGSLGTSATGQPGAVAPDGNNAVYPAHVEQDVSDGSASVDIDATGTFSLSMNGQTGWLAITFADRVCDGRDLNPRNGAS